MVRKGDPPWTLEFDGEAVPCSPGETIAEALLTAGKLSLTRSLKYRRHRGAYCLVGDCGTCLARVDGEPNIRTCLVPVRDGQKVASQNRVTPIGPDPTALADKVFAKGFDHHHLMVRPRALNEIMKGVARNLAGLGTLPDRVDDEGASHQHLNPDVVVIGHGSSGHAFSQAIRAAGLRCTTFERTAGSSSHDDDLDAGVFGVYPDEGLVAAAAVHPRAPDQIYTARPRHLVFATGARDGMSVLNNNDLPGIVSARGLLAAVRRTSLRPCQACVVVGEGPQADAAAQRLGAERVDEAQVESFEGGRRVERVVLRDGRKIAADVVAMAPRPSAASELARQAGASVRWDGAGFPIEREEHGTVQARGPWTTWAVGEVAGMSSEDSVSDGRCVAAALLAREGGRR